MFRVLNLLYRINNKIFSVFLIYLNRLRNTYVLIGNGVKNINNISINGPLMLFVSNKGNLEFGKNIKINSGQYFNPIGRNQKTRFWVDGNLKIGDATGLSSTAIICHESISIGKNVKIGGNTVIYDTDFHSLKASDRIHPTKDKINTVTKPVIINDNVFIGSHVTILKGVTIGVNSIIAASSVVSKSIPDNEIWGGNPIKFIRKLNDS